MPTQPLPSYNQLIFDMLAYFPTQYPSELAAQISLFLTTSSVDVTSEGEIRLCRGWEPNGREMGSGVKRVQDRSKESILGDAPNPKTKKTNNLEHNWSLFDRGEDCMFYPLHDFVLWPGDWYEHGERGYGDDVFNAILRGKYILPDEEWKDRLFSFCCAVQREDELGYKAQILAYLRKHYKNAQPMFDSQYIRYWEGFVKVRDAATRVSKILHPPGPQADPQPAIDAERRRQELIAAHRAEVQDALPRITPGRRTIADAISDYQKTPEAAKDVMGRITDKLMGLYCPHCHEAVPVTIET